MAVRLLLRAPLRFGVALLLLGLLGSVALHMLPRTIPLAWGQRLGMFLLPLGWVLIAAIARGADDSAQQWRALKSLTRPTVWLAASFVGFALAALSAALDFYIHLFLPASSNAVLSTGRVLEFIGAPACLIISFAGICYFPLVVLEPDLSLREALHFSKSANELNDSQAIGWFAIRLQCIPAALLLVIPAYGLTSAAWIVFMGVVNYVAYRDIFERRSENSPMIAATVSAVAAVHISDQRAFDRY